MPSKKYVKYFNINEEFVITTRAEFLRNPPVLHPMVATTKAETFKVNFYDFDYFVYGGGGLRDFLEENEDRLRFDNSKEDFALFKEILDDWLWYTDAGLKALYRDCKKYKENKE